MKKRENEKKKEERNNNLKNIYIKELEITVINYLVNIESFRILIFFFALPVSSFINIF